LQYFEVVPALSKKLDQISSRGAFQPKLFCDSEPVSRLLLGHPEIKQTKPQSCKTALRKVTGMGTADS